MPESSTRTKDLPHFRIAAAELAKWLDSQEESWWSVDGDPILTQRLDFPCQSSDLAVELRKLNEGLLLVDSREEPNAAGELIESDRLGAIASAFVDDAQNRVFQLQWESGPDVDWLLIEVTETSERIWGLGGKE